MQTMKKIIAEKVLEGVRKINPAAELTAEEIAAMLEYPPTPDMGDLAFPCFKLSRALRRSPVQIAATLSEEISADCLSKVEAVNGYLNLTISPEYLAKTVLPEILEKKERYGAQSFGEGKKVVLD